MLSVCEYFRETGDLETFELYLSIVEAKLEVAQQTFANPSGLRFVGWDDRTGSGFANNTTPETQNLYRMLAIRAWTEFADALTSAKLRPDLVNHYRNYSKTAVDVSNRRLCSSVRSQSQQALNTPRLLLS